MRRLRFAAGVAVLLTSVSLIGAAHATITPTSTPSDLAAAVASDPSVVTGASFAALPPAGTPNAVSTTPLASFPTDGSNYAILTTGDPTLADQANNSGTAGLDVGGVSVRGNTDFDVTILKIDLAVPAGANCLALDFRFLTEEFPEFVGSNFNDAFIAELDNSTWTTSGSTISAPNNFAFDPSGDVISVNSSGATSMTAGNASGTTYDGATPLLSAATPIAAGAHSLYLSIFDQGDHVLDSAVFIDNLILGSVGPGGCQRGATVLSTGKTADSATTPPGGANGYTITITNQGSSSAVLTSISDTLPSGFTYTAGSTTGVTTADPAVSGQTLTWAGPFSVPGAGSVSLHFLVTVSSAPGDYLNNASADAGPTPVTPTGPTAQITVTAAGADLSITKADVPDPVALGGTLTYTLAVTNNGPDPSTDSTVTDTLPAEVTFVSATASQGSCAEAAGTVTCPLGPLAAGASATVDIVVTVDATALGPLGNTATVAGVEPDPVASNNTATADTAISAPTVLDHFKCYKTKQAGTKFDPRQVILTDQFNTERVNVVRPEAFCAPADKDGSGIANPSAHLTCYKIGDVRGDEFPKFEKQRVEVTDQFGTHTLLLKKIKRLCVPSSKSAAGEVPGPPPAGLDHFKCYKTKQVGPKFDPRQVVLTDQFGTERVNVVRPEALCTPVDKDGSGINDPTTHLACYKIRDVRGDEFPKFKKRRIEAGDQFGTHSLLLKKTRTLCLPSSKTVL